MTIKIKCNFDFTMIFFLFIYLIMLHVLSEIEHSRSIGITYYQQSGNFITKILIETK